MFIAGSYSTADRDKAYFFDVDAGEIVQETT